MELGMDRAAPAEGRVAAVPPMEDTPLPMPAPSRWLHQNIRNILAMGIGGMVLYLAVTGHEQAQQALTSAFTMLVGMIYAERSALKIPGKDS